LPTAPRVYIFVPAYRRNVSKLDLCAAANFLSRTATGEKHTVKKSAEEACRYPTAYSSVKTVDDALHLLFQRGRERERGGGGEARAAATHKTDTQNLMYSSLCPSLIRLLTKFFVSSRQDSPLPCFGLFVNL